MECTIINNLQLNITTLHQNFIKLATATPTNQDNNYQQLKVVRRWSFKWILSNSGDTNKEFNKSFVNEDIDGLTKLHTPTKIEKGKVTAYKRFSRRTKYI